MKNNYVQLVGYVGNDPKITVLKEGGKRALIRVATHDLTASAQAKSKYSTTWHVVVAWDMHADFAERTFVKGSRILINGSIKYRKIRDSEGREIYFTDIKANWLTNLDR